MLYYGNNNPQHVFRTSFTAVHLTKLSCACLFILTLVFTGMFFIMRTVLNPGLVASSSYYYHYYYTFIIDNWNILTSLQNTTQNNNLAVKIKNRPTG